MPGMQSVLATTLPFGRKSRDGRSQEAPVHLYKSDLPPRDFRAKGKVVARLANLRCIHLHHGRDIR